MSKPLCTVLIPFDAPGQARFAVLEAMGESLGYRTMRVAQYYSSGMILEEIVRSIRDAHLIIADLTAGNPNVCYEVGLAHALGKRVFLVADDPAACRIDFGPLAVSRFDATPEGVSRMSRELGAFVATPGMLSPIDVFTGGLAVAGQPLLLRRICAFLIDLAIAGAAGMLVFLLAAWAAQGSATIAPADVVGPAMLIGFLVMSMLFGTTPGQRSMGLVVTGLDRAPPSRWQRLLRPVAALVTMLTLGLGFLWAGRSPRHQAVHDLMTRTLVLRRRGEIGVRPQLPARR